MRIFWFFLWGIFSGATALTGNKKIQTEEDNVKLSASTKQVYMATSKKTQVKFTTFIKTYTEQRTNL
jgi:hypothetical protein